MSDQPIVTIAIPTRNREHLVSYAVDSVLSQTYKNLQIIIANNASNDSTKYVLEKYQNNKQIELFHHEINIGMVGNWNFCLNQSIGEFFILLSDDDVLTPTAIEKLVKCFREKDVGIVFGNTVIRTEGNSASRPAIDEKISALEMGLHDFIWQCALGKFSAYPSSTMYRSRILKNSYGYLDNGASSDYITLITALYHSRIHYIPVVISEVLEHNASVTSNGVGTMSGYNRIVECAVSQIITGALLFIYSVKNILVYRAVMIKRRLM